MKDVIPLNPNDTRTYVERYLLGMQCRIIESSPGHIQVRLSEQADRDLVNRPFYWSYVEKLGLEPQPVTLTFIFDPEKTPPDIRGERIFPGSTRLEHIFQSACQHGRFVRLYEDVPLNLRSPRGSRPYIPWLNVNYKIEWISEKLRSEIHSLGIQLLDGTIDDHFYSNLVSRRWTPRLPSHRYITEAKLSLSDAVNELEFYMQGYLDQVDDTWAKEAKARMQEELERLAQYYEETPSHMDEEAFQAEYERRIRETKWQYQPRIEVTVVNAGLFYLA